MAKKNKKKKQSGPQPSPTTTPAASVATSKATELSEVTWWPAPAWVWSLGLFAIYGILPFWRLPREAQWFVVVPWLLVPLALLVGWCALPLGKLPRWRWPDWLSRWDLAAVGGLLAILIADQARYLVQPFTWKGDEEFFVNRYMWFVKAFGPMFKERYWVIPLAILAIVGIGLLVRSTLRRNVFPLLIVVCTVACGMRMLVANDTMTDYYVGRYPPLLTLVEILFANQWLGTFYAEWAHRLACFVPIVLALLVVYFWMRREGVHVLVALGTCLVLAFMPMVQYQATILHIEPLVLLWMTVILYLAWSYQKSGSVQLLYLVSLIAAAGGLIKETSMPFILATWIWLVLAIVARQELGWGKRLQHAVRLFVVCFLPSVPYMLWRLLPRAKVPAQRPYGAHVKNLLDKAVYSNYLHSLTAYMTFAMLIAALVGVIVLLKRKRHGGAAILALISTFGYVLFFAMDEIGYVGYVRFMMHFWPIFVVGLVALMVMLHETRTLPGSLKVLPVQLVILVLLLGNNLAFHPPAPENRGVWGRLDTEQERHFPINRTLAFIQQKTPPVPVVMFGHDYGYFHIGFYLKKHNLQGRQFAAPAHIHDIRQLINGLNVNHVIFLYQRMMDAEPVPEGILGLVKLADFTLGPRGMAVYEFTRPAAPAAPGEE